jgi:hypothetical protein
MSFCRKTDFPRNQTPSQAGKQISVNGSLCADFRPFRRIIHNPQGVKNHDRKAIRHRIRPALQHGDKTACIASLQAEIDRLGGVPYGWMRIYEVLLFGFYNPRTGQCFPSHKAIAIKARCGVRTVQRALKWAREHDLVQWAHGLVRDGWRVLRTSNRYAFAAFLTMRRVIASIAISDGQRRRGVPTSYLSKRSFADIAAEARSFRFPPAPSSA